MYAILQLKENSFVHINYSYGKPWATGFSANPNFFAETMILCLSYSIGLFIEENKSILKKIILIELIIFFTIGLLIGNTLSCFVALIVVLIFLLVYCLKYRKKLLKFLLVICIIASLSFILASKGRTIILKDIVQTQTEITDMLNGNIKGEYGTFRIEIWRQTLKVVPDHLLHGVGIDNFIYAFNGKTLKYNNKLYDKAHNDYLQILVTQGIFSLLCYLLLYGMVIVKGAYNCFKNEKIILILPVIGYLTQIFFNISVIEVAPIFYISLGLLYNRKIIPQNNQKKVSYRNKM